MEKSKSTDINELKSILADEATTLLHGKKESIKANYQIILNRKKAIQTALRKNNKDKIVLIFGKGHENYQIFSEKKRAFNDNNEVKKILNLKK